MARPINSSVRLPLGQAKHHNGEARARSATVRPSSKRTRGSAHHLRQPFSPPEDWHEPSEKAEGYRFIVRAPGAGYRHVLTPDDVRARLAELPPHFLRSLEVVQFATVTRKKKSFPCYGLQWGTTLYLYPIEASLIETYYTPPAPALVNETRMYGGRWVHEAPTTWRLYWSESAIRDFYLNNILIHELGHLVDDWNSRCVDRERYAEWFAIEYGYRPTADRRPRPSRRVVVRHGRK